MKNTVLIAMCLALGLSLADGIAFAQQDKEGCADPPLFTRVPGFYLYDCKRKEFDVHDFVDPVTVAAPVPWTRG